jgi:hypothetical protein
MSEAAAISIESAKPDPLEPHRFKPGQSGNPSGRPKGIARVFREMVDLNEAAKGLLAIATDEKTRSADRIKAWAELLDRGYGKAPAFAAVEGYDPLELDEVAQEIQRISDDLKKRREQKAATAVGST